ncbi:MAG: preprotein translocase subunit SecE [Mycoplasmataceae bacterium]|nr:preprotein translocase subunit SecE [Mycoplasmataceae bacterium]
MEQEQQNEKIDNTTSDKNYQVKKNKLDKLNFEPDKSKPYPVRNFFKELKRVTWPTKKSNYKYFLWVFVFVVFLVLLFALVSWGATELIKLMGAN